MFSLAGTTLHPVLVLVLLCQTLYDCVKFLKCIETDAEIESQITECIDQMFLYLQAFHLLDTFLLLPQIGLSVSALAQVSGPHLQKAFILHGLQGAMSLWICVGC